MSSICPFEMFSTNPGLFLSGKRAREEERDGRAARKTMKGEKERERERERERKR